MLIKCIETRLDILKNPVKYKIEDPIKFNQCLKGLISICRYTVSVGIKLPIDIIQEIRLLKESGMGCWNGTDMLGGMPILCDDEIYAVVIVNQAREVATSGFCYVNGGYATPLSFPIKGTYNDYGGIDFDENQLSVKLLKEYFLANIDKLEIFDRKEDTPVEDILNDMNKFINDYVERDLVMYDVSKFIYGAKGKGCVGIAMYSESLINNIYHGIDMDDSFNYREITKTNILNDVAYFIEDGMMNFKSKYGSLNWDEHSVRKCGQWNNKCAIIGSMNYMYAQVSKFYLIKLTEMVKEDIVDVTEVSNVIVDTIMLFVVMDCLRLSWRGDAGKGSQDYGLTAKIAFIQGVVNQINEYYHRCNEETSEDLLTLVQLKDVKDIENV